ncbi:MAG: aminotransferase class V-fold PLP-dependent enzyme [Planctomycetaceae bacterium]|nr:aminotransferase class V-fold PLP-dependent enzyme [Planctomycetaceae bacterium]MBT6487907.1 aminotransferase class V-fold PLP-dependent enzyme [Planctomycetaceae bacterium]
METTLNLHKKYNIRRVINACGKMTHLGGAIVLPEIAAVAAESFNHFFELDEIQMVAGRIIAEASGAESGCVTACTSAGITLSVAASMTGNDIARVFQLPNADGMPQRVLIQKGHCVQYGAPITQSIRLAGATPVEVGVVNRCQPEEIEHELKKGNVAAVVAVESHHTVRFGWVKLPQLIELAHAHNVPVIVDGAAQDLRLRELIGFGADLVIVSAHKYLCSTTGGVVAGRKQLVDAVYLQNKGIGRGMKAGKEAIFGAMAALEYRMQQDIPGWTAEQDRKVELILSRLTDVAGLSLSVDPDPNGCPFSRARLTPDPQVTGHTAKSLAAALIEGDPTIVPRAHHADEGYLNLDAIEMTDEEIEITCEKVRRIFKSS